MCDLYETMVYKATKEVSETLCYFLLAYLLPICFLIYRYSSHYYTISQIVQRCFTIEHCDRCRAVLPSAVSRLSCSAFVLEVGTILRYNCTWLPRLVDLTYCDVDGPFRANEFTRTGPLVNSGFVSWATRSTGSAHALYAIVSSCS